MNGIILLPLVALAAFLALDAADNDVRVQVRLTEAVRVLA